jgi:hypothetical protein
MIADAIDEAVEQVKMSQQLDQVGAAVRAATPHGSETGESTLATATLPTETKPIHQSNMDANSIDALLRQLVLSNYENVEQFFEAVKGKGDAIGRTDFKTATKKLGLNVGNAARKELRKRVAGSGKTITRQALARFMGNSAVGDSKAPPEDVSHTLCSIPSEVPDLPSIFQPRDGPLSALISSLIDHSTTTISLTAPKSRKSSSKISSQGMASAIFLHTHFFLLFPQGGCGKTTITVAAIRSFEVRKHFESIGCE